MEASHVCTLDNALVGTKKHHQHKLHIMPTSSASEVFAPNRWQEKHHQRKLQRVKTVLGTNKSRIQQPNAGSTRARDSYIGIVPLYKLQFGLAFIFGRAFDQIPVGCDGQKND